MRKTKISKKRIKIFFFYLLIVIINILISKYLAGGGKGTFGSIYTADWDEVISQIPIILIISLIFLCFFLEIDKVSKKNKNDQT